jgi:hypothetical protein
MNYMALLIRLTIGQTAFTSATFGLGLFPSFAESVNNLVFLQFGEHALNLDEGLLERIGLD